MTCDMTNIRGDIDNKYRPPLGISAVVQLILPFWQEGIQGEIKIPHAFCNIHCEKFIMLSLWRNRIARSAVNRKVGGSSPPRDDLF